MPQTPETPKHKKDVQLENSVNIPKHMEIKHNPHFTVTNVKSFYLRPEKGVKHFPNDFTASETILHFDL